MPEPSARGARACYQTQLGTDSGGGEGADGGVRYQTDAAKGGGTVITMNSNGYYSSNKLGYLGNEDLSDGWNAHFRLENGFNLGNGQLDNTTGTLFNRQAYVGMGSKKYGSIDFGRPYTISHDIISIYDPCAFHYTPILPLTVAPDGTRNNNAVKYKNEFGTLLFEMDNSFGGVAGNFSSGATRSVGVSYHLGAGGYWGRVRPSEYPRRYGLSVTAIT
ncbi:putative porin [Paraburkholderia sp. GAS448]